MPNHDHDYGHDIRSLKKAFAKKETSPREVFALYRERIKDEKYNAFLSTEGEFVSYESESSALAGIPYAAKDNMLVMGQKCTAGSKILENYRASYDGTVIKRLGDADAQLLGKTNLDEFAMGSSGENSAFGAVKNPLDVTRVPGGSSAGSAAAVAGDLCVFALGSDTGGSVRLPAALCGIVGLKPTYGRVSRHGLIALASSLDQISTFTKTVHDAAEVLNVIAGEDRLDSTTAPIVAPDFTEGLDGGVKGLRIGVPDELFGAGLSPEVKDQVMKAINGLEKMGAEVLKISLPHVSYAVAVYYIVMPCEASANLARYDGIRYGLSSRADSLLEVYTKSRGHGFGSEPTRRIMLGTYALSAGYFDAYYLQAQKVRALIRKDYDEAFERVDIIAHPTSPTVAFKLGEKSDDPLSMYLSDVYTISANLTGQPAVSVSAGLGVESGLPTGIQLTGRMFDEATILRTATAVEKLGL